ncbi:uncharacterized protein LOC106388972 [Brassica napus]|uniref:Uncharacterized protein n=2 Tax=Brassica oleracea TaxID=3712 RepID=A0A0D3BAB6_BRAOL|nr:PREDICTED: uncharacterized protein LOC106328618 [Brassica oleracea var. oleracea]XP_013684604.1 uncharacterized protein LOC106388972 [Brassica napus]VDC92990.1 unnamed protein product [Brassica oleracea]
MKTVSVDETKNTVVLRAEHRDDEGRKAVDKLELKARNPDTIKQVEKKLMEKGVQRMERHPSDGTQIKRPPPKSGRGGKYTWEGSDRMEDYEMQPDPPAMDEGDPNYDEEKIGGGGGGDDVAVVVVKGEVEVANEAPGGVARVEVDPRLFSTP